jgi:hypothetical protein
MGVMTLVTLASIEDTLLGTPIQAKYGTVFTSLTVLITS